MSTRDFLRDTTLRDADRPPSDLPLGQNQTKSRDTRAGSVSLSVRVSPIHEQVQCVVHPPYRSVGSRVGRPSPSAVLPRTRGLGLLERRVTDPSDLTGEPKRFGDKRVASRRRDPGRRRSNDTTDLRKVCCRGPGLRGPGPVPEGTVGEATGPTHPSPTVPLARHTRTKIQLM